VVLKRNAFNKIRGIQREDGIIMEDLGEMKERIVEFYRNLLSKYQEDSQESRKTLLENILRLIFEEKNNTLIAPFLDEEVYEEIVGMGK